MIFLGILIGGIIGTAISGIGGVWGAIFGGIIGMVVSGSDTNSPPHFSNIIHFSRRSTKVTFFKVTFMVMGRLAKVDGHISTNEINQAEQIMDKMQLTLKQRQEAIILFKRGKNPEFNIEETLEQFKRVAGQTILLPLFLEIQLQAAYADGYLTTEKQNFLTELCVALEYDINSFNTLHEKFLAQRNFYHQHSKSSYSQRPHTNKDQLNQAYTIIGVSPSAPLSEIKHAYRKLMSKNHPDKLVAKGLPENMIVQAKQKTQEIQSAYDTICQHKKK